MQASRLPGLVGALILAAAPVVAQPAKWEDEAARLNVLAEHAYALNMADDHAAAEPALRQVVTGWRALGWGSTDAMRSTVLLWAWSLVELAQYDEAEAELLAIAEDPAATGEQLSSAWGLLARMYSLSGRFNRSEQAAEAALDHARRTYGEAHPETATAWHNLGTARGEVGQNGEAVAALRRAVALREELFGPTNEQTLLSIYNLAAHLHARGAAAQAEPLLREVLAHAQPGGDSHIYASHHLGYTLSVLGRHQEAEPWLRQAASQRADLPDRHMEAVSLSALGDTLRGQGRHAEAEQTYARALGILSNNDRAGLAMTRSAVLMGLAENHQALKQAAPAEDAYRQAVVIARANVAAGHPRLTLRELGLATFFNTQQRADDALAVLRPSRDALLGRAGALSGGEARAEMDPFRSLFRETVRAAWTAAQPEEPLSR